MDREARLARVLALVASIPPGRLMTYGDIATVLELGSPRHAGAALKNAPAGTPWHRVVRSDGTLALGSEQAALLDAEGIRVVRGRADVSAYRWMPRLKRHGVDPRLP